MKQSALMLSLALTAWGQSPPTVTVADTIYTGVNGGTTSGRLQITSPERTYNGQPLILPAASITIVISSPRLGGRGRHGGNFRRN